MKKIIHTFTSVLYCVLLLLTACAPPEADPQGTRPAMGRYVEEELPLPAELVTMRYLDLTSDGSFLLLGTDKGDHWRVWRSRDGGETWTGEQPDWLEVVGQYNLSAFTLDEQDRPWFTHEPEDPVLEALYAAGDHDAIDAHIPPVSPLYAVIDGAVAESGLRLQDHRGNNAQSISVRNGVLAANYGNLAAYDTVSGRELLEVEPHGFLSPGDYHIAGDILAVAGDGIIQLYDIETGRQAGELRLQEESYQSHPADFFDFTSRNSAVTTTGEPGVYAYCNSSGIYRLSADGSLHEKILSGDLTSLILPGIAVQRMYADADSYYVYVTDRESTPWKLSGAALLRYRYDETYPASPTTVLRVFSLEDVPSVRQAVGVFQRDNPDIQVKLEVALSNGSVLDASDALRSLSTQLLAGQGPDVLVLDGLPVEQYREKGALLDLGGLLSTEIQGQILPNLLASFGTDGAVYALPTRFTIPMLLADDETREAVGDLPALAALVTDLDSPQTGVPPEEFFDLFYPVFGPGWFRADGMLDTEPAARDLESLYTLVSRYGGVDPDELWNARGDMRVGAIGVIDGWTPFYLGELASFEHLAGPYTAERDHGVSFTPYPAPDQACIHVGTVVGVNAASQRQELAASFVACMLSDSLQSLKLGDGLPVNRRALEKTMINPDEDWSGNYGVSFYDEFEGVEKGLTTRLDWPDRTYFDRIVNVIESVDRFYLSDRAVVQIVREEVQPYFSGQQSLDETVQAMQKRVDLHAAE